MTEQGQVGQEIAKTPAGVDIARRNRERFSAVLPNHIEAKSFVGLAEAAVYRNPDLMRAAEESPRDFFDALVRCASLGHRPGTEEFYLVPFKHGQRQSVQGIEGYRGIVERMYRSGAVASVIVREVCENDDFEFVEGEQDRPRHHIDWFGSGRGDMIGVYAYAVMTTGATSRVVILNRADIEATKQRSRGSDSPHSPWQNDTRSMWWKTAARRLEPWVPTSVEFFKERVRAASQAAALFDRPRTGGQAPPAATTELGQVDTDTGEILDAEIVPGLEEPPPPASSAPPSQTQPAQEPEPPLPAPTRFFTTRTGRTELAADDNGQPIIPPGFEGAVFAQKGDDRSTRTKYAVVHPPETPQAAPPPSSHDAAAHEAARPDPNQPRSPDPCSCGMPEVPGVIHRSEGPCYLDPAAVAAEEAEVLEAEELGGGQPELASVPDAQPPQAPQEPEPTQGGPGTYTDDEGVQWVRRGPRSD